MTGAPNRWEEVYRDKQDREVSWFEERPDVSLDLIARSGVGRDTAIVDVGAGASRLVDCLVAEGFSDITVLDLSETALSSAKTRLGPGAPVEWVVADLRRWSPPRPYGLWHDRAAFHFLTEEEDRAAYLSVMGAALAPGGFAIIGTFAVDGPEKCSGLPVRRYDAASLSKTLGPGYRLLRSRRHEHRTPAGAIQRFHYGLFERL